MPPAHGEDAIALKQRFIVGKRYEFGMLLDENDQMLDEENLDEILKAFSGAPVAGKIMGQFLLLSVEDAKLCALRRETMASKSAQFSVLSEERSASPF